MPLARSNLCRKPLGSSRGGACHEAVGILPLPTFLPSRAQVHVIAPLAPHERRLRHKLLGTDRADHAGHPLTEHRDVRLVRNVVHYLVVLQVIERSLDRNPVEQPHFSLPGFLLTPP